MRLKQKLVTTKKNQPWTSRNGSRQLVSKSIPKQPWVVKVGSKYGCYNEIECKPEIIIASYHGIPKKYFDKGDPYHCYCHKTTRLIKESYKKIDIQITFQSRFGPQEWLTPYTDKTLEDLPKKGIKNLLVICPGFASDCVETLEEIDIQGRDSFLSNGGENFDLIPCLNDADDHIDLFEKLVKKYI